MRHNSNNDYNVDLSQSFQINSKRCRAKALKPAANGRYCAKYYPTIYIYCPDVHLSFCNYMNENFEISKMQVNGPLPLIVAIIIVVILINYIE